MPNLCYLCGKPADLPLQLKDSFTAHSACKCPTSTKICNRCNAAINGDEKQLWYWNEGKGKWSPLWGRSLSRLYQGDVLLSPTIEGKRTEKGKTFPVVSNLATRAEMRSWLLEPPSPPFTIAISESGQKHILPWAQEGLSQDHFPVQFELDTLWVNRGEFTELLGHFESLMALEFSKTEILSGEYHSDRLMRAISQYFPHESVIAGYRGGRLLQLVNHVAQKPAPATEPKAVTQVLGPGMEIEQAKSNQGQLALWG